MMAREGNKGIWGLCKQFIKFGLVGVSNTLIYLAIYYIFVFMNKDWYIFGNIVGFLVSVCNAYYWNSKYVFKSSEKSFAPFIRMFSVYLFSFLLGTLLLYIFVDVLHISEYLAPILKLVISVPLDFALNKLWAFKDKKYDESI